MIWKINLGLAGICGLLAAYGFHHSKILKPSEIFMYFLGNVLLYFFTKNIMGTYKELVEKIYWKPTDGESPYNFSIFGDSLLLFGSTGINKGFMDDVFDLRWKYKIIFPIVASLPLLANYPGTTVISVPLPLRGMLGTSVDIGLVYYVYASMLSIFCMNSINIYAGINGLEVGQSLIIGFSVICINILEIVNSESIVHIRNQFLSLYVVVPFITVSLLLLYYNKYPSIVFVGDTYCYFAGTVFASVGILGHFSKTLLLMFLPQIFNFVISIPQLLGIKNCPRHRLAKFDKETGKLNTTYPENYNLLNYSIAVLGPQTEKELADKLIILQVICCTVGIVLRYTFGYLLFD